MSVQSFRDSIAWQRAMDLSSAIYGVTRTFPREEMFGLTNQLRRASVSVASNIAEGQGRLTTGEFLHFLGMARGSALEIQTQLEIARRQGYSDSDAISETDGIASEVVKILNAVIATIRTQKASASRY